MKQLRNSFWKSNPLTIGTSFYKTFLLRYCGSTQLCVCLLPYHSQECLFILKHKKNKGKNIKYLPYFTGILHNIPPNLHDITAPSAVNIFKDWNNAAILTTELMLRSTIIVSLRYLETFSFKLFEVTWKRNCCRSSVHDHCQKCYCSQ